MICFQVLAMAEQHEGQQQKQQLRSKRKLQNNRNINKRRKAFTTAAKK